MRWPASVNTRYYFVMHFKFSLKVTLVTGVLALGMIKASLWQWDRHLQKQELIKELDLTLTREPIDLSTLISSAPQWERETFRRVRLSGSFDFEHEFLLRNRNLNGRAGSHIITPLKIDSSEHYVLVDRGFVPIGREGRDQRVKYQSPTQSTFFGLVKNSAVPKFMAPNDPPAGEGRPWVDQWLRVDISNIQKQIPYPLIPIYLETMENPDDPLLASKIVRESAAGKSDVLMLTGQKKTENFGMDSPDAKYPIPSYDITPPPDIHLGYVYEWAFMALLTALIGVVMQMKRPNNTQHPST